MKIFGKPKNKWGWGRIIGLVLMGLVLVWIPLSAILRAVGEVPWMMWSGYQDFTFARAFEMLVLPFLVIFIGGWMEEQDARIAAEQSAHVESEQTRAAHRREAIRHFHASLNAVLEQHGDPMQVNQQIAEILQSILPGLDGKGRGEVLHHLHEKGLLAGAESTVRLDGLDFSGAEIQRAHLEGANLAGINLTRAKLEGAHLAKTRLAGANLTRAFLRHADLRGAVLTGSNLKHANLRDTSLEGADLRNACLEDASFIQANLKDCILSEFPSPVQEAPDPGGAGEPACGAGSLDEAILVDAILPDGRKVTNAKGREYMHSKEFGDLVDRL